jgi:hypothetical protein
VGAGERDPFVDQRAGIGAGDAGFGGAQVPQPAEAEQAGGASQTTTFPANTKRPE